MDVGMVVRVVSAIGGVDTDTYIGTIALMVNILFLHVGNISFLCFNNGMARSLTRARNNMYVDPANIVHITR